MDNISNARAALHNLGQGLASFAKATYLLLVVIPASGVDAYGRKVIEWFALITAVAFWVGYSRADAVTLVSTTSDAWRPESWIMIATVGVIWLAWSAGRRQLDKMS